MYIKSELKEQRSHKAVTVMSIEFDLLLLVSLQLSTYFSTIHHTFSPNSLNENFKIISFNFKRIEDRKI